MESDFDVRSRKPLPSRNSKYSTTCSTYVVGSGSAHVEKTGAGGRTIHVTVISHACRNAIIGYYFQLGMQQKEICDRLDVDEAAVSKFISGIKELVPNYQSEDIGAMPAARAAAEPKTGKPKRAGPGDSLSTGKRRRAS
jgi:hypothetical protein